MRLCRATRVEEVVLGFMFAREDELGVVFAAQLYGGAGLVVRQAALAEEGGAEREVGGDACDTGVVGGEFVFPRADLHGVDGALDV